MPEILVTSPGYSAIITNIEGGVITVTSSPYVRDNFAYYIAYDVDTTWTTFSTTWLQSEPLEYECCDEKIP